MTQVPTPQATNKELAARLYFLRQNIDALPEKDRDFARSLCQQYMAKAKLSEKQWVWVQKLADAAEGIPDFTDEQLALQKTEIGDLSSLMTLFKGAGEKLKFPAIHISTPLGTKLKISVAGPTAKFPGTLNVVNKDNDSFLGRVTLDGVFDPYSSLNKTPALMAEVVTFLRLLSRNPAGTATSYGLLTGHCCFCNSSLTDANSLAVGYGKTCAKQWGLPYGKNAK